MQLGWSADSRYAYFGGGDKLYRYDATTDSTSELLELPYTISTEIAAQQAHYRMSPDRSKIVFWKFDEFVFIVDLDDLEIRDLQTTHVSYIIDWQTDSQHLILMYSDETRALDKSKVFLHDIENGDLQQFGTKTGGLMFLSSTGRYLSYVGIGGSESAKTHRVYDLKSDTDALIADFGNYTYSETQWLHHDSKDYLVIQQQVAQGEYFTTIFDPENNSKCRIGWTIKPLEFQPQG